MDAVLSQLGKIDSRRDLTICWIGVEALMANARAEEAARKAAALPPPVTPLTEAERATLYAALEAARREMLHGSGTPAVKESTKEESVAPDPPAAAPTAPPPPLAPSPTPIMNPFFAVLPLAFGL
jgi:hypothetical protein